MRKSKTYLYKPQAQVKEDNRSERQAAAQFDSIKEMVEELKTARDSGDDGKIEEAEQRIHEDALSVQVRSGRYEPGREKAEPEEFEILLCTGGPAVRIIGSLNEYQEPESARIEHQDWFTPWTEYRLTVEEEDILLAYCQCFYFGQ